MNCAEVKKGEYISRYLLGELDEQEIRELEEHYFSCDDCFEALKDALALRSVLQGEHREQEVRRTPIPSTWAWGGLAAAVILLVGISVILLPALQRQPERDMTEMSQLAATEAPPYEARRLRGAASEADKLFREAMVLYQEGDYAGAIPGLEAAASSDPESTKALFFLGACYLLTERPALAMESFDRVVAHGDTPYLERTRFYRTKALLRLGRLEEAREELERVVNLGGEMETEARQILDRLPR